MPAPGEAAPGRRSRPISALLVVVAVLAAGCGRTATSEAIGETLTRARPGGSTTAGPPVSGPGGTATTGGSSARVPGQVGGPATSSTTTAPAVNTGDEAIVAAADGPPGGAAGVILQPAPAASLVVEVLEEPGATTNRVALSRVLSDLRKYSQKTVTEVHTPLPAGSAARRWTERDLERLAFREDKIPQGGGRFVLRLLSVKGQNVRSPDILAESFLGDTVATFPDSYASLGQHIITTVIVHEVGHILGLVDLYLDRGRADTKSDPAKEGHSMNPASVMFWAVDPSAVGSVYGAASERFDAQDERDLAAIRAGAPPGSNPR